MKYIDLEEWKRKEHFEFFYRMDYPQFNICMNLDIKKYLTFTKGRGISFYYAMIYAVTDVVNQMDDFKYRIRDGKVVLHDKIHPSFTYMDDAHNNELFKLITVDFTDDIVDFEKMAKEASQTQKDYFGLDKLVGRDDLIYITCIPWVSFTHISHTITINRNDSVPKISWGKYYADGDKVLLPFSVQVNHALIDGFQIGQLVERLQKYLDCINY
jgi:chloramphenicol O-acetyltransferase type A